MIILQSAIPGRTSGRHVDADKVMALVLGLLEGGGTCWFHTGEGIVFGGLIRRRKGVCWWVN